MPCRDSRDDDYPAELARENKKLEAFLCAIIRSTGDKIFNTLDYEEGGFKRNQIERWWSVHQAEDARRIQREKQQLAREELRKSAISKLTIEELAALGIK